MSKKLGIKPGQRLAFLWEPPGFMALLAPLPADVRTCQALGPMEPCDVIVLFATEHAALAPAFVAATKHLRATGGLWVAWPKKASGVATDLVEDRIRTLALANGLVDNKVCAIDATWSGLRCVVRVRDRAGWAADERSTR